MSLKRFWNDWNNEILEILIFFSQSFHNEILDTKYLKLPRRGVIRKQEGQFAENARVFFGESGIQH